MNSSKTSFSNNKQRTAMQTQLRYLQECSPFYKRVFEDCGFQKEITQADFCKLPITYKEDLAKYNEAFRCVPKRTIIDYVTTSGTLGNPVTFALNEHDLNRLAVNEQQSFQTIGVQAEDVVQITTTLDRRFMAGMAYFLGLRKLGAGIVRVGAGLPAFQWDSIQRFQPKYLVAVPSFLIKLGNYALEHDIDLKNCSVQAAICIGEPIRDEHFKLNTLGRKIEELWGIELFSTYASTEMSTAFTECKAHQGNHIQEDLIYTEVLDEDGNSVAEGEIGELVITHLSVETMPLLRYATGDMVRKIEGDCSCGREGARLSAILGRKKQLIKYKGTSLYPQQIQDALEGVESIGNYVIQVRTGELETDELEIMVDAEISAEKKQELAEHLRASLRVLPKLIECSKEKLQQIIFKTNARKPIRFIDLRD